LCSRGFEFKKIGENDRITTSSYALIRIQSEISFFTNTTEKSAEDQLTATEDLIYPEGVRKILNPVIRPRKMCKIAENCSVEAFELFLQTNRSRDRFALRDESIYKSYSTELDSPSLVHQYVASQIHMMLAWWIRQVSPRTREGVIMDVIANARIVNGNNKEYPDVYLQITLPDGNRRIIVVEVSYDISLEDTRTTMQHLLRMPTVYGGIIVAIRYPLNHRMDQALGRQVWHLNDGQLVYLYFPKSKNLDQRARPTEAVSFGSEISRNDVTHIRTAADFPDELELVGNVTARGDIPQIELTQASQDNPMFNPMVPNDALFAINPPNIIGPVLQNNIGAADQLNFHLYDIQQAVHRAIVVMNRDEDSVPAVTNYQW
jgi:hypothetical protein